MAQSGFRVMTLKIGDRVRFLNDVGGGTITAFIDNKMVEVKTDDGFEIPVLATELLREVSSGYGIDEDGPSNESLQEEKAPSAVEPIAIRTEDFKHQKFHGESFLAVVPENEKLLHVSDFKLYLINDSNYTIQFQVSQTEGNVFELVKTGELEPDTKMVVARYGQAGLGKLKALKLQGFYYKSGLFDPQPSIDVVNSIEGISFYKAAEFSENDYFNSKAIVFKKEVLNMDEVVKNLSENEILKVKQSKDKKPKKVASSAKSIDSGLEEVDLHIEEIVDHHTDLSNGEILNIQMSRFETALETAIKSKTKRVVFIHGVGNGKLKHELRKKLDRKYSDLRYQDASFKEYGYGATMVTIR
jgi:hypothetical protein